MTQVDPGYEDDLEDPPEDWADEHHYPVHVNGLSYDDPDVRT